MRNSANKITAFAYSVLLFLTGCSDRSLQARMRASKDFCTKYPFGNNECWVLHNKEVLSALDVASESKNIHTVIAHALFASRTSRNGKCFLLVEWIDPKPRGKKLVFTDYNGKTIGILNIAECEIDSNIKMAKDILLSTASFQWEYSLKPPFFETTNNNIYVSVYDETRDLTGPKNISFCALPPHPEDKSIDPTTPTKN